VCFLLRYIAQGVEFIALDAKKYASRDVSDGVWNQGTFPVVVTGVSSDLEALLFHQKDIQVG
jgi:hypothetical protein